MMKPNQFSRPDLYLLPYDVFSQTFLSDFFKIETVIKKNKKTTRLSPPFVLACGVKPNEPKGIEMK